MSEKVQPEQMPMRERFRDSRNLLILLGFICQGYGFETIVVPVIYAGIWALCLFFQRRRKFLFDGGEELIAVVAIVGAYALGGDFGYNRLVFIGNGMVVVQATRLLRPLSLREKMFSLGIALIHLGVGTQVVVGYEFILVLLGAVYLVPAAFFAMEAEQYKTIAGGQHARYNLRILFNISVLMVVFFLFFPRFQVLTRANPLNNAVAPNRHDIDMTDVSQAPTEQIIFRIEGEDIDYIKQAALDKWDGRRWSKSTFGDVQDRMPYGQVTAECRHRKVKIMHRQLLGQTLPTDGYVIRMTDSFIQRPVVADHGGVLVPGRNLYQNYTYEYWSEPTYKRDSLLERDYRRFTLVPEQSPALRTWLDDQVGNLSEPEVIADQLAGYFRDNHIYEMGAPRLDEDAPIDDFVLNMQNGHCERFASALAVLLRMKGIPARVGIGWVAAERNSLGGFYNVRAKHGHAWTELWVEGKGWVIADATPNGRGIVPVNRALGLTIAEWVEFIWYSKIVEFGSSEQLGLASMVNSAVQATMSFTLNHLQYVALLLIIVVLVAVMRRIKWQHSPKSTRKVPREEVVREAQHFYGRMLRYLARFKVFRKSGQTPNEFVEELRADRFALTQEVSRITSAFCAIRYGQQDLTPEQRQEIDLHLRTIKSTKS